VTTRVKTLLLAAFLVFDLVLIVGVVRHVRQDPPSSDLTGEAGRATSTSTGRDDDREKFEFDRSKSHSLSIAADGTVLRALRGRCDGGKAGELVVSTDRGRSLTVSETGLREIVAVSAESKSELHIVGATASCALRKLASADAGTSWQPEPASPLWHVALDDSSEVVSPNGRTDAGCTVTSLAQIDASFARVTCSDGRIRGTGNGGRRWLDLGRLDNVRVASFSSFNTGHALAVYQGCAAQEMTTRDGGRTWRPGGCISGERAQAVGAQDGALMAVVDGKLYVSEDAGASWKEASG
jgi:hypothetical protein